MSRRAKNNLSGAPRSPEASAPSSNRGGNASLQGFQQHPRWQSLAVCLFLALAVWAVYGQTLHHDFINYDDPGYVYENRHVLTGLTPENLSWAFTATHMGNWHPLVWLSFMIDYELHGLKPGGFHLTNVLLHAVTAMLLFLILRNLTGALWRSAFVAALFALHPLHVESVAWVTERKDVLSALFWMLTMWGYLLYVNRLGTVRYLTTVLLFALGLMAKPMLVTMPAVLLLLDWWPLGRIDSAALRTAAGGKKEKPEVTQPASKAQSKQACALAGASSPAHIILEKLPFIALALAAFPIIFFAQHKAGAVLSLQAVSLGSRIANAIIAYVLYLWKMLWPASLYNPYLYSGTGMMQPWWKMAGACLVLAGLTFTAVKAARKRSYFLFGWLWYLGTLIPVIGFVQIGAQTMADRYTYIPLIGIFIIIAWGADELSHGWRYRRAVLGSVAGVILAGLLAAAYVQTGYWKNDLTFWKHTLACDSENYMALNNIGNLLTSQGKQDKAMQYYERALRLNPSYVDAHYNLGVALAKHGILKEAIEHFERAIKLNPNNADAYYNLGLALGGQGKLKEALQQFERAIKLNPNNADAHNNAGVALAGQGNVKEAIEQFERAIKLNPNNADAHNNLGSVLAAQGKLPEAITHFQKALNLAMAQKNTSLAESIRAQLKSYPAH